MLELDGVLTYSPFLSPRYDMMGPFSCIPFMQCRHSVFSMGHRVSGSLVLNGRKLVFLDDYGYIEGDRGTSFPENYLWTQSEIPGGSLMLSVASIPILGGEFTGFESDTKMHEA